METKISVDLKPGTGDTDETQCSGCSSGEAPQENNFNQLVAKSGETLTVAFEP